MECTSVLGKGPERSRPRTTSIIMTSVDHLAIIAGKGAYPLLLAESARKQGVKRISVVAFKGETDATIARHADQVRWLRVGELVPFLNAMRDSGAHHAVMAGQITPTNLFNVRLDRPMFDLLCRLRVRNAETIFGAVGEELKKIGIDLLPAYLFMESAMPDVGIMTVRQPTESELADIELGLRVAKTTSGLEIGQTVVVKQGTIIAVEAFEGTDETILRAGKLAGAGTVIVKVAKHGHDMRFDIPVIGERTIKLLKKIKAAVLAVEAKRTIVLERDRIIAEANRHQLCVTAVAPLTKELASRE